MTDAKLVRFGAVVVVLAAYVFVFRGGETRITERLDENARIAERVRAGERTLASRPRFEAERRRLRDELRAVELDAGRSALVARFLREAARIAAAHHAAIPTITAMGAAGPVTVAPNAPVEPLEAIPLEITVEGRYADVLATMRALSRSPVLAAVDFASLARKHADGADATLTAALHVALERTAPAPAAPPAGSADVRAGRG
jgi:Tfp pilus assembly protein PilO